MMGSPTSSAYGPENRPSGETGVHPAGASIGLVALNASYAHTALSLRYLRNAAMEAGFSNSWILEYTTRTPAWKIASELLARKPAVLGFSVYIWNRRETLALIELLKKQQPSLLIVAGGPEVSFENGPLSPYVDAVIAGEGEVKWVHCLRLWAEGREPDAATLDLWSRYGSALPALERMPYLEEELPGLRERLVYLETSRGCPYTCSFCLSALDKQVRFFPDAAVTEAVNQLVAAGVRKIKFLDRTFNLGKTRMRDLFGRLREFHGVEFHFEIVGDLLDDEMLSLLETVPPGMFQFEIGVQSALTGTQRLISRRQNKDRLFPAIVRLMKAERVHLHLDLIWGLPGETLADIRASFQEVISLFPHQLQLGFLKFLPGAPIGKLIEEYGYSFQDEPPYETIAHRDLSAPEMAGLHRFEEVFDLYYNSGRYRFTLARIFQNCDPWAFFQSLADYFTEHGLLVPSHGPEALSRFLLDCARGWRKETGLGEAELIDFIKLDYFYRQKVRRSPLFLRGKEVRESPAARARRKADPDCSVAVFHHRISLADGAARLEPSSHPIWYVFSYPNRSGSYFFRPALQTLEEPHGG